MSNLLKSNKQIQAHTNINNRFVIGFLFQRISLRQFIYQWIKKLSKKAAVIHSAETQKQCEGIGEDCRVEQVSGS